MQTKHLYVLIHIRIKGEAGTVKLVQSLQCFLLTVPRRCFYCGSFLLFTFHVSLYYAILSVPCSLVISCWERADLLFVLCVMLFVYLSRFNMMSCVRCGT